MVSVAQRLAADLDAQGDPVRAAGAARYLKSTRPHLGVRVPDVRSTVRSALRTSGAISREVVLGITASLWASAPHEHRLAAVFVLANGAPTLRCDDLVVVEQMLRDAETWAVVDPLATGVVAPITARPSGQVVCGEVLDRWAQDPDVWVRRAALLALLPALRAGEGDWDRFSRYADSMLDEREFFVRKAIGWVLRDTARRRPALVAEWTAARPGRVPVLAVREAARRLSPEVAEPLVARAYRAR